MWLCGVVNGIPVFQVQQHPTVKHSGIERNSEQSLMWGQDLTAAFQAPLPYSPHFLLAPSECFTSGVTSALASCSSSCLLLVPFIGSILHYYIVTNEPKSV